MIIRDLTGTRRRKWRNWARQSIASKMDLGLIPFQLKIPYTIYACRLEGLKGRLLINRETEEPLFLVQYPEGNSVCHLHGHIRCPRPRSLGECRKLERDVLSAGRSGRAWWGVERLSDPAWHTAILYVEPP
jgi:hypothetical protein